MKFLSFELENILAYSEKVSLDLSATTPDRNIILVWGRNGMGKTSFLNAIKLLFLGAEDRSLRTVGFPPKVLGNRQYVLGSGPEWTGVINTRARDRLGEENAKARVRLVWEDDRSRRVAAERSWVATPTGYRENLVIDDGENRLTGDPAEERLSDFLPRDFVPFFFFDGEDIKSLAEQSEGRKAVDFDRVLRISFINELAGELTQVSTDRQRQYLPAEIRLEIKEVEGEIGKAEAAQYAAEQAIQSLEDRIVEKRSERRQLMARRENLRSGATSAERQALEDRRNELVQLLESQSADVNKLVPPVSPMLGNPGLVTTALEALDQRLSASGTAEHAFVRRVEQALPDWLRDGPPELSSLTANQLAEKISRKLESLVDVSEPTGLFAQLDIGRAQRVKDALLRFSRPEERRAHANLLAATRRTRLELERVRETLLHLEVGSQATLDEYRAISSQLEKVDEETSEFDQLLGQQHRRKEEAQELERDQRTKLRELERQATLAEQQHVDAAFVQRIARSLNDLREELRSTMRERVQQLISEKFNILVHDHNLVDSIELDDTYTLTFLDSRGQRIGRSSLSSGLKQLAATALLWAMKEVPGHQLPVVIDTPLGRIDRENQDNMLLNYYPQLSHQVIILPTNAEIDHRKYNLIHDRVAAQYRIYNDTGDEASIREGSLLG